MVQLVIPTIRRDRGASGITAIETIVRKAAPATVRPIVAADGL